MLKIKNDELIKELVGSEAEFPKYATQLINLANQNAQGTRPKVVGQLSELINECPKKTYEGWRDWYLAKHPDAIKNAVVKINQMMENFKLAIKSINKKMIEKWVRDLVLEKTYVGLRFQEAILKKVAQIKKISYQLSTAQEESCGIDGYVGGEAVSVKPMSYKTKAALGETLGGKIIFYEKKKDGLNIDADLILK
ncbi:MjaI family restriction endonuclease [Patescibacteria group bacterium]|nr:MAG: MjaI family restriction endonuclease [Patescibacteria group bacterium]